jgi:uncharacterized membrane protein YhaH (DUF805 family)
MQWYLSVLKKYAVFSGRASRSEFWFFQLFNVIALIVLAIVDSVVGTRGILEGLYGLAVLLPSLSVIVRRLHDIGRSGWWFFIELVPAVGVIILIVFLCQDSQPVANQYGVNPKGVVA